MPASIAARFQGSAQAFQGSLSSTPILILAALVAIYSSSACCTRARSSAHHYFDFTFGLAHDPDARRHAARRDRDHRIILMIGIVNKNGIMSVDFALGEQYDHGLSGEEAIHPACLRGSAQF
jgi:hypothetical protein